MEKNNRIINRCRLEVIINYMNGFRSDFTTDMLLKNFRLFNATVWSEKRKE